ncbi:MAG: mechanosensitive ion channel [Candidatus Methanomethylicia archaeon]
MAKNFRYSLYKFISIIALYIFVSALIQYFVNYLLISILNIDITSYKIYIDISLGLSFGYMLVYYFSEMVYWSIRFKYDHSTAAALRSLFRLLGIGAMLTTLAGALSNPTAGVALGGFIGMIIGYASQQSLGQIMSGIFLLLSRPFKIGDKVEIAGIGGYVEDVTALFVIVSTDDGKLIYLPCNTVLGSRIIKYADLKRGG